MVVTLTELYPASPLANSLSTFNSICVICGLRSRQLPVLNSMRHFGGRTEACLTIFFVVGIVAFEPNHTAIAFERQHMRCCSIQEPAIVRDNHRATGKVFQRLF